MSKGVDAVSSSGHPGAGYAGGLGSIPGNQTAKKEQPRKPYEDPNATRSIVPERICNILQALHSCVEAAKKDLKFQIHEDTDQVLVKVIAKEDGRVIREIPSEALLELEARFDEMTGVLFSKEV